VRNALQFLLTTFMLAALALLADGGRAQAGYVTLSAGYQAHTDSFLNGSSEADLDFGQPDDLPQDDAQSQLKSPLLPPWGKVAFVPVANGMGSQPSPGGSGAGSSSPVPAATSCPQLEAPALVGTLFLESASHRPPPFPSRLFRPPRLSEMLV
jgi:hypothetical protein